MAAKCLRNGSRALFQQPSVGVDVKAHFDVSPPAFASGVGFQSRDEVWVVAVPVRVRSREASGPVIDSELQVQAVTLSNIRDEIEACVFFRKSGNHPSVWAFDGHCFCR